MILHVGYHSENMLAVSNVHFFRQNSEKMKHITFSKLSHKTYITAVKYPNFSALYSMYHAMFGADTSAGSVQ